jgi:hypothetical protein
MRKLRCNQIYFTKSPRDERKELIKGGGGKAVES